MMPPACTATAHCVPLGGGQIRFTIISLQHKSQNGGQLKNISIITNALVSPQNLSSNEYWVTWSNIHLSPQTALKTALKIKIKACKNSGALSWCLDRRDSIYQGLRAQKHFWAVHSCLSNDPRMIDLSRSVRAQLSAVNLTLSLSTL